MPLLGTLPFKDRKWAPQLKISGVEAPAETWIADPNLPPLGLDPRYPTRDQVVIPRGRLLAVRPDIVTYEGEAVLTLADGAANKIAGFTESNIYRKWPETEQWRPTLVRKGYVEVPYIPAINDAYSGGGRLTAGDRVTAYFGSTVSTTPVPGDKGKIVKWVPKSVQVVTQAADTACPLSGAIYPGILPRVIMAWNAGTVYSDAAATLAWNDATRMWDATFGSAVTDCLYETGQDADQIAGLVLRVEPISATHELSGWLKWVRDNFLAWDYPPQMLRVPTTDVSGETPATVSAGSEYRLAHAPIANHKTITVNLIGSITDATGVTVVYTGEAMPLAALPYVDYTLGQDYSINPMTGTLYINGNVTVSSLTVSYSYETSFRDGRLWASGIIGLTDGANIGVPGTPPNLDVAGCVGSLRVLLE